MWARISRRTWILLAVALMGGVSARLTHPKGLHAASRSAPEPVTNTAFSKALGRALKRPAIAPVPGFAVKLLYGDMAEIVTEGQRAVPERPLALGFTFQHPDLDEALRDSLRS